MYVLLYDFLLHFLPIIVHTLLFYARLSSSIACICVPTSDIALFIFHLKYYVFLHFAA